MSNLKSRYTRLIQITGKDTFANFSSLNGYCMGYVYEDHQTLQSLDRSQIRYLFNGLSLKWHISKKHGLMYDSILTSHIICRFLVIVLLHYYPLHSW